MQKKQVYYLLCIWKKNKEQRYAKIEYSNEAHIERKQPNGKKLVRIDF